MDYRPIKSKKIAHYLAESRGLERDYIGEILNSRKWAWIIASVFGGLALFGLIAGVIGIQREVPPPVVLRVDNATGAVDGVQTMAEKEATYGEITDQYWLNQYVLNRESYDDNTIQKSYEATGLMSTPEVAHQYQALYRGANARDQVLGKYARIAVTVRSIVPDVEMGIGSVRFTTQQMHSNGTKKAPRNWIATVRYHYLRKVAMKPEARRINLLGFQVSSYRIDPETLAE